MAIDLCVSYSPITIKLTMVTPSQLPDVCKLEIAVFFLSTGQFFHLYVAYTTSSVAQGYAMSVEHGLQVCHQLL